MARRSSRRSITARLPRPLRPIVGSIALVGSVRLVDAVWRRVMGRPAPTVGEAVDAPPTGTAEEARLVRDRVLHGLLMTGAMRFARRLGLPDDDGSGSAER